MFITFLTFYVQIVSFYIHYPMAKVNEIKVDNRLKKEKGVVYFLLPLPLLKVLVYNFWPSVIKRSGSLLP